MSMTKVAGTDLATGMSQITGMVAQSGSKSAGGELKTFKDESGNTLSVYVDDAHDEVSFEGLLRSGESSGKSIGDQFTACGVSGYITAWTVQWSNDDVTKVSGSLRDFTIVSSSQQQNGSGSSGSGSSGSGSSGSGSSGSGN